MMKRLMMIVAAAGAILAIEPAVAMPVAPHVQAAADSGDVIQVRHGGRGHHGWHRSRGHHYGWHRGRGHHYGWHRGHGHHYGLYRGRHRGWR